MKPKIEFPKNPKIEKNSAIGRSEQVLGLTTIQSR
jgi:hypothetical protein